MPESVIQFFGQPAKVACDGLCSKAWGRNSRPTVQLSDDDDDFETLADYELGQAPADPGTYEGGHGKPASSAEFPNKWCVRECERCSMSNPGDWNKPLEIRRFDRRNRNKP